NLLDLLAEVRKLGFSRLEFRACQIGADDPAMKKVADFLQVKTVVGPKAVETFYGSINLSAVKFVADDAKLAIALRKLGGRQLGKTFGILAFPRAFQVVARDKDALKTFVTSYIKAKFAGNIAPLV